LGQDTTGCSSNPRYIRYDIREGGRERRVCSFISSFYFSRVRKEGKRREKGGGTVPFQPKPPYLSFGNLLQVSFPEGRGKEGITFLLVFLKEKGKEGKKERGQGKRFQGVRGEYQP